VFGELSSGFSTRSAASYDACRSVVVAYIACV
jgi:hypothetical protein